MATIRDRRHARATSWNGLTAGSFLLAMLCLSFRLASLHCTHVVSPVAVSDLPAVGVLPRLSAPDRHCSARACVAAISRLPPPEGEGECGLAAGRGRLLRACEKDGRGWNEASLLASPTATVRPDVIAVPRAEPCVCPLPVLGCSCCLRFQTGDTQMLPEVGLRLASAVPSWLGPPWVVYVLSPAAPGWGCCLRFVDSPTRFRRVNLAHRQPHFIGRTWSSSRHAHPDDPAAADAPRHDGETTRARGTASMPTHDGPR